MSWQLTVARGFILYASHLLDTLLTPGPRRRAKWRETKPMDADT